MSLVLKPTKRAREFYTEATGKRHKLLPDFKVKLDGTTEFDDLFLSYTPNKLQGQWCRRVMHDIKANHALRQDSLVVFGRQCKTPRKQVLLSKQAGARYKYSGIETIAEQWDEQVDAMCTLLSEAYSVPLNSCLVNLYRDGHDNVGRHADDEDDMEHDVVVTVSIGATRLLRIYDRSGKEKQIQIALRSGSVWVQKEGMQRVRQHEIPRELRCKDERMSLTFRQLKLK